MRPIEMEHTEYAWELQPAAMPVIRSSGAKSMRGSGAAGSQPVDGYLLQRLVKVRPLGMKASALQTVALVRKARGSRSPDAHARFRYLGAVPLTGRVCARRN